MKTKICSLLLLACLLALSPVSAAYAQGQSLQMNSATPQSEIVIFTFRTAPGNYTTFSGDGGEGRYYIQVPADNVPSYRFDHAMTGVKVLVDNEKSNEQSFVFSIPIQPGTTPRVERQEMSLIITFLPPRANSATGASNAGLATGEAVSSPASPVPPSPGAPQTASPAPQTNPLSSLVNLLPFEPDSKLLSLAEVDLAVPESPAFTVLGLTPQTVVRPSSPREFASSLLNGIDQHGNFQSGLALDAVPYWIMAGSRITLGEYRKSYRIRLLSRTQFSFANTKGASDDDKSVKLALGLRLTLWDEGDPHSDKLLTDCFRDKIKLPGPPAIAPPADDASPAEQEMFQLKMAAYESERARIIQQNNVSEEQCRADSRKRNWNSSSWAIGLAPSWISQTGESKNFKWDGGGFWTSLAYGFKGLPKLQDTSQLLLHARYRNTEQVPDEDNKGKFLTQDSFFFGGRWRFGNPNTSANLEAVYERTRPQGKAWDSSARYSVGLERKIAENIWFALSLGGERGRDNGKNDGFVLSSFRWGFSQKRTIPELNPSASTSP